MEWSVLIYYGIAKYHFTIDNQIVIISCKSIKNWWNLLNIDAKIEKILIFARHCLAVQASRLTCQNALQIFLNIQYYFN